MLFEALPHRKTEVNELAATVLPTEPADATRFSELAQHHVASHLLERILCAASDERFAAYYTTYFRCGLNPSRYLHRVC